MLVGLRGQKAKMPARILLVHDDRAYMEKVASTLQSAGHDVATFATPMAALGALETNRKIDLLVTKVLFEDAAIHGIALARMARLKCLGIRILFLDRAETQRHTDGIGEFTAVPIEVPDLVQVIERLR